jgi:L-lactate dehydrogenase complex protein LldE
MTVRLMLTCLCDAFYGEVGIAAVNLLEYLGCDVVFPDGQTCCGQPLYNTGEWSSAKAVAMHCVEAFRQTAADAPIVTPSSSCAAMLRHGYPHMGIGGISECYELAEFIVRRLNIHAIPNAKALAQRKIAYHSACHGRVLGLSDESETLLRSIPGVELAPINHCEQCCGFGGAFAAKLSHVSTEVGWEKIQRLQETGADEWVSGDMGCLMHLSGIARRRGMSVTIRHYAEVLAEALPS